MLIPLLWLLTFVKLSSGLVVRHSNGSLVQFEKEKVVEQVSPDLIVGSYSLQEHEMELKVMAGEEAGQYRLKPMIYKRHTT